VYFQPLHIHSVGSINLHMEKQLGLNKEKALQLITENPAKILGIDEDYGTLEVGKSATLFIS
jgi:imidazolonepropionase-like amidohydrolase